MSGTSQNVGCRRIGVFDDRRWLDVPTWLLYPTHDPARIERFGPYAIELATDAALVPDAAASGGALPLVVISHGNGATPWVLRGLIARLVTDGFVVAALEHPGNNRNDNSLSDAHGVPKLENLERRPHHVRLVIDAAFADPQIGPRLSTRGVAVVGYSIGGYTAVAVAGGRAVTLPDDVGHLQRMNPDAATIARVIAVATERDPRVRAIALLAPALPWFLMDGALAAVDVPMFVRTGERDMVSSPSQVLRALRSVPDPARVDHRTVANAGHFSFMTPFPPELARPDFAPAHDPPGFARAKYQDELNPEISSFLRATIGTL